MIIQQKNSVHNLSSSFKMNVSHIGLLILCVVYGNSARRRIRPNENCQCGLVKNIAQNLLPKKRIVGGKLAEINEFPWTAGLFTHRRCRGLPVCGGALISTQHVLTAAHCIARKKLDRETC